MERWGGNDGPDDVMETFHNWPLAHALGADDRLLQLYERIWEGHLDQFQRAKAPSPEMARNGMFWRESALHSIGSTTARAWQRFITTDYQGRASGCTGSARCGSRDSTTETIRKLRTTTSSIRSFVVCTTAVRGPKLTPATVFDWGGEAEPGADRHTRYRRPETLKGDHPLNLGATTLGMDAFLLTGERKYADWVLEYVDAWRERILQNSGDTPTNIGLDGRLGGEWGRKWYGGTFGWNFDPQSSSRNYYMRGVRTTRWGTPFS